jgi:energy-coupling factor transporter ATPase
MIEFSDVSFSYDGKHNALDNVSLSIEDGEFVCFLGSNGSGKSTFAKHINALLVPDEGTVTIYGISTADAERVFDIRSQVGFVFQNPDNQLVASLVENEVAFGPENLGLPATEIRSRVTEALFACGLQGFEKRETSALSGGEKQRVAIAGALAMRPRILVLDEATSMLDPLGREGFLRVVCRQHEAGKTVVMITHSMEEAAIAQRIVVMQQGSILANGPTDEILTNVELLQSAGLELPFTCQLANELEKLKIKIKPCIRQEACEEEICRLF